MGCFITGGFSSLAGDRGKVKSIERIAASQRIVSRQVTEIERRKGDPELRKEHQRCENIPAQGVALILTHFWGAAGGYTGFACFKGGGHLEADALELP
jgi:hypothetical protein